MLSTVKLPTRELALRALEAERVPCAPVLTLHEAVAHPHLRERQTVRHVADPHLGEFDIPGLPVQFSAWPIKENLKADLLGENNEEVLRQFLGTSDSEIAKLYADGVLVRDKLLGNPPVLTNTAAK